MREDMKAVIADTFSQMLDKEDIDKITVTKLIAECHISRQTFYYHFKDIMDVLEWTFRRATQELVQIARSKVPELDLSVDDLEVMLRFYACGMVGVLLQYMEKPNLNEEKLVIQMEKIITGKMFPGKHD